jgi:hypothetical protein
MFVLLILCLFVGCLIVVPLIFVAQVLRLVIGLALLPFRLVGLVLKLAVFSVLGVVGLVLAGTVLLIPLLPVVALAGAVWLMLRLFRGRPAPGLAS